jgi:hypothetical protein
MAGLGGADEGQIVFEVFETAKDLEQFLSASCD